MRIRILEILNELTQSIEVCPDERSLNLYRSILKGLLLTYFFCSILDILAVKSVILYIILLLVIYISLVISIIIVRSLVCGHLSPKRILIRGRTIDIGDVKLIVINTRENTVEIFRGDRQMVLLLASPVDKNCITIRKLVKGLEERGIPVAVT